MIRTPRTCPRMARQEFYCPERAWLLWLSGLAQVAISLVFAFLATTAFAEDWPTWRYDAARSAQTSQTLPQSLHLLWVRQYPELKPAYRTRRLQFDAGYEPVVLDKTMFVASSAHCSVNDFGCRIMSSWINIGKTSSMI